MSDVLDLAHSIKFYVKTQLKSIYFLKTCRKRYKVLEKWVGFICVESPDKGDSNAHLQRTVLEQGILHMSWRLL